MDQNFDLKSSHTKNDNNLENSNTKENFIEIVPVHEELLHKHYSSSEYNSFTLSMISSPNVCEMSNQLHKMTFKRPTQDEINHKHVSKGNEENKLFKKPPCIEEIERQRTKFQKKRKTISIKSQRKLRENYQKFRNNSVNSSTAKNKN